MSTANSACLGGSCGLVGELGCQFGSFAKFAEATPVNFFGQEDAFDERKRMNILAFENEFGTDISERREITEQSNLK